MRTLNIIIASLLLSACIDGPPNERYLFFLPEPDAQLYTDGGGVNPAADSVPFDSATLDLVEPDAFVEDDSFVEDSADGVADSSSPVDAEADTEADADIGVSCDDDNPCTINDKLKYGVCVGEPDEGAYCNDGDPCKKSGRCNAQGKCEADPKLPGAPCISGADPCFIHETCDEQGVCGGDENHRDIVPCDDNDPCTISSCVNGACTHCMIPVQDQLPKWDCDALPYPYCQ